VEFVSAGSPKLLSLIPDYHSSVQSSKTSEKQRLQGSLLDRQTIAELHKIHSSEVTGLFALFVIGFFFWRMLSI
jgi:hypothetical protein